MSEQHTMIQTFDKATGTNTFRCRQCGRKIAFGPFGMVVLAAGRGRGRFSHSGGFSSPGATLTISAQIRRGPRANPNLKNWTVADPQGAAPEPKPEDKPPQGKT